MTVKGLTKGDTIRCADKYEAVEYLMAVMEGGQDADFLYEKDGEKGLWVVVGGPLEETEGSDVMSEWIPVTERLPVNHDEVIISLKGYEKTITASYIATKNFFAGVFHDHPIEEVTAWMPLPEPYKEDKHD